MVLDFTFDFALGKVPAGRFIKGPCLNHAAWGEAFDASIPTTEMAAGNLTVSLISGYDLEGIGPAGSRLVGQARSRLGS